MLKCCGCKLESGRCCKNKTKKGKCYLHKEKNEFQIATEKAKEGIILYPWASSFIEWLLPILKKKNIP